MDVWLLDLPVFDSNDLMKMRVGAVLHKLDLWQYPLAFWANKRKCAQLQVKV